jgi:hypothetical protein
MLERVQECLKLTDSPRGDGHVKRTDCESEMQMSWCNEEGGGGGYERREMQKPDVVSQHSVMGITVFYLCVACAHTHTHTHTHTQVRTICCILLQFVLH